MNTTALQHQKRSTTKDWLSWLTLRFAGRLTSIPMPASDPTGAERQRRYRDRQAGLLPPAELLPCACCPRQHTGTHGDHCWECWRLHTDAGRADRAARVARSRKRRRREQEQVS